MAKKDVYQDYEPGYDPEDTDYLYDWVFHYNIYTDTWAAITRDSYTDYWSDSNLPGVIKSSSFTTLIEILHRIKGDVSQLEKKLNLRDE